MSSGGGDAVRKWGVTGDIPAAPFTALQRTAIAPANTAQGFREQTAVHFKGFHPAAARFGAFEYDAIHWDLTRVAAIRLSETGSYG